jgi:Zn-dependent M28 family amino/carboxypeptidase
MKIKSYLGLTLLSATMFLSCQQKGATTEASSTAITTDTQHIVIEAPLFNADSAYAYIKKQVDFGPRVPNTNAHKACAIYLAAELRRFGAEVTEQRMNLRAYDNTILESVNIIGSFNPEKSNRVALFAHWDSRPFADNDTNPGNHQKPVSGANDGASGVGVLLEIARLLQEKQPSIGVDIIFFDAEDYGQPYFHKGAEQPNTWCLGSQYWAAHPHKPDYRARFGILLDMVGASNAHFAKDVVSMNYASHIVNKVWEKAASLGYGHLFVNKNGGSIIDDHLYVNQILGIPTIDIIDFNNGFPEQWHTIYDTMEHIDKATLKAVGQTLLEVLYNE